MTYPIQYQFAKYRLARALWRADKYINGVKAANATDRYTAELQSISKSSADENELRNRIIAILLLYALFAYEEGLEASGVDNSVQAANQPASQAAIQAWVALQTGYAQGLAQAMTQNATIQATPIGAPFSSVLTGIIPTGAPITANGTAIMTEAIQQASADAVLERIRLWGESLNALRVQGQAAGATLGGDDPKCYWRLGPTDEHCHDERGMSGCYELSQREPAPLSEWATAGLIPRAPGNEEITCHGYHCLCELVTVDGQKVM